MGDDIEEMGPVDYLVVEFPGNRMTGEGFPCSSIWSIAASSASSTSASSARTAMARLPHLN